MYAYSYKNFTFAFSMQGAPFLVVVNNRCSSVFCIAIGGGGAGNIGNESSS